MKYPPETPDEAHRRRERLYALDGLLFLIEESMKAHGPRADSLSWVHRRYRYFGGALPWPCRNIDLFESTLRLQAPHMRRPVIIGPMPNVHGPARARLLIAPADWRRDAEVTMPKPQIAPAAHLCRDLCQHVLDRDWETAAMAAVNIDELGLALAIDNHERMALFAVRLRDVYERRGITVVNADGVTLAGPDTRAHQSEPAPAAPPIVVRPHRPGPILRQFDHGSMPRSQAM